MSHACLIRAVLPDTHALCWHMHTKGVVLDYLQTTSVNWSGGLREWRWKMKESRPMLPCLHLGCCRQRCIERWVQSFVVDRWSAGATLDHLRKAQRWKPRKTERSDAKLFLHCLDGAFVICINLGLKHTWCQKGKSLQWAQMNTCCGQSTPSIIRNTCPAWETNWSADFQGLSRQREFLSADSFSRPTHLRLAGYCATSRVRPNRKG